MHRTRILVSKLGLDGHDRGAKFIARTLRDAGAEVIYLGLRQTPAAVAAIAVAEDVDLIGLSILSGAHVALVPQTMRFLAEQECDVPVVVGGIIPAVDRRALEQAGVAAVFGPGEPVKDMIAKIERLVAARYP